MNELTSVGLILLLALLAGHIVKLLRIPEVTGYLLAGVALGPSVLGWISTENLTALEILSEVALGLILFSIGTIFEFDRFRSIGWRLGTITFFETMCTMILVGGALLIAQQPPEMSVLLGVMATETAAASTLMVIRERNAAGPVTDSLIGVFALDNLLCLLLFSVATTGIQMFSASADPVHVSLFHLVWQFAGAIALGYLVGFLLAAWSVRVTEHGEQLMLLAGCVLLAVGASKWLQVSAMVANLMIGATVVNFSQRAKRLIESLSQTDPPLYAIFFVLAGAELDVGRIATLGVAGSVYIAARFAGKFLGTTLGTRVAGVDHVQRQWLRYAMFAQAGLAVGLSLTLTRRLPDIAPAVSAVVLSSVMIFEITGPFLVAWAIARSGESHVETQPAEGALT